MFRAFREDSSRYILGCLGAHMSFVNVVYGRILLTQLTPCYRLRLRFCSIMYVRMHARMVMPSTCKQAEMMSALVYFGAQLSRKMLELMSEPAFAAKVRQPL